MRGVKWTDEQLAILKREWPKGTSCTAIAAKVGKTKNAITGMADRLNLPTRRAELARKTWADRLANVERVAVLPKPRGPYLIRFKKHKPAPKAHPLVRRLIELMNENQLSLKDICGRASISRTTFNQWRTVSEPKLSMLEACYNVLGKRLIDMDIEDN